MEMKREQRLITEKYDFLEKTSHTENIQCDPRILWFMDQKIRKNHSN